MAPPAPFLSLQHRIRRAHPARPFMNASLTRTERRSRAEILRYQERRLRLLVRLAASRSPYYRSWFRTSGTDPRSIRTLDDLARLPLLDRSDLSQDPDQFRVYPARTMWAARSSGTSGAPVTCYRTTGSSAFELSALERQWGWFGLGRGSRRVVLRGSAFAADQGGAPTKLVPGAGQLLVSSYHLTAQTVPAIADEIRQFRPDAVEGWPSSMALLAALLRERGETLPVRAVITSSEVISPGRVALLQEVFQAPVVGHYGQTERVALAGTCEAGGYHVFPEYGIVELMAVPGVDDRWEIVGTPLHNWGFPLFRYRTGDQVGPADPGPCPCGRAFQRLGAVDGRVEDSFLTADGRQLPLPSTAVDDLLNVRQAQIAQLRPGRFDVRLVPGRGFDLAAVSRQVDRNVERLFGPGQELSIQVLDSLPRTAGGKLKSAVVEGGGQVAES